MKEKASSILKLKGDEVYTILIGAGLFEAAKSMQSRKIGALVVLDKKKKVVGIISERDVLKELVIHNGSIKDISVEESMTRNIIIGKPDDDTGYLMRVMTENRIRHIPILENEKLAGFISLGDLVKSKLDRSEFEKDQLSDYITSG